MFRFKILEHYLYLFFLLKLFKTFAIQIYGVTVTVIYVQLICTETYDKDYRNQSSIQNVSGWSFMNES